MTLSLDMPTQPDGDPAHQNFMLGGLFSLLYAHTFCDIINVKELT